MRRRVRSIQALGRSVTTDDILGRIARGVGALDFKYEVTVVPVSDVDRAKEFYGEGLGWAVDVDHRAGESFRVV
jgi:hypothetical protein